MRVAFFGSGAFGLPTLAALFAAGHDVAAVVTRPDRPAGRGRALAATPIKEAALRKGVDILQPENPADPGFVRAIERLDLDLAAVVAYGCLLKPVLLAAARRGFVNLHASLLPAYRGAAPVPWAILNGETMSGATAFVLDERFDAGGVLGKVELPIDSRDTAGSYLERLAPLGAELMAGILPAWNADAIGAERQDDGLASRAPILKKSDALLDWNERFDALERRVRAFQPWPLAHAVFSTAKGPIRVNVLEMEPSGIGGGAVPGEVRAADDARGLVVMTGDRPARLRRLQPEGKRPMGDTDFLRGTAIRR
ncbi:MAG: methionyl-tRNA formyltransferase [Planctomycetota bacterium]|nr:methionyl-tRNA formyltransferase [Planctomycetota bacterium]